MKDNILLVVSILLLIGIAVAVFFIIDYSNVNEGLTDGNKQLSGDLADTEEELEASQEEVEDLEAEKETLIEDTTTLTSDIADTETTIADLTATKDDLQVSYDDLSEFAACDGDYIFDIDITSSDYNNREGAWDAVVIWYLFNIDVNIEDVDGGWFWDFTGSPDLVMVKASGTWETFLIFYSSGPGTTNGVFYVDEQCWLDGP